jgi:hypothetical protein
MRKLAYILAAAAVCLTTASALTTGPASAQGVGVTIGVGDRDHWRGDRDHWRGDRDHWRSRDSWRGHRSYARNGVVISTSPRHCRNVTVRTYRPNGTVVIRKHWRCN